MIKITPCEAESTVAKLRVDGRINAKTAEELVTACRGALASGAPVVLDLAGVTFVDGDGARVVDALTRDGAVVIGCSPLVTELLRPTDDAPRRDDVATGNEAALIAALRCGDADAFETIVRRYSGRMLAVARRMLRSDDDAEDAVQEAF